MTFICPFGVTNQLLNLYDLTTTQLANITSLTATGTVGGALASPGPFTSIPPNICLLPNLKVKKFNFNVLHKIKIILEC